MNMIATTALLFSLVSFIAGLLMIGYGLHTRRIKKIEAQLFDQYAAFLFTEFNVHERFANPIKTISAIVGHLEVEGVSFTNEDIDEINAELKKFRVGVSNLKRILKMLDGRASLERKQIDIAATITNYLREEDYGELVILKTYGKKFSVVGTKMEIIVAVSILVDNALQYGVSPVLIELKAGDRNRVAIIISGNGEGTFDQSTVDLIHQIDNVNRKGEIRELVAKRLKERREQKDIGGNGIGLIIAHLIARSYHGELILKRPGELLGGKQCQNTTVVLEL